MTAHNLTKLAKKYTQGEIATAVKVLVDILALQENDSVITIDPSEEFTLRQIRRLQKQLAEHSKTASSHLSLNETINVLGL